MMAITGAGICSAQTVPAANSTPRIASTSSLPRALRIGLESRTETETEDFGLVEVLLHDRETEIQANRPEGRAPTEPGADAYAWGSDILHIRRLLLRPAQNADIGEQCTTDTKLLRTADRKLQFQGCPGGRRAAKRSEEQTSELQSLMRNSYAVF